MNRKIFNYLVKNLQDAFNLPKYDDVRSAINKDTDIAALPWTPKRWEKFVDMVNQNFDLDINFIGTIVDITNDINEKYCARF